MVARVSGVAIAAFAVSMVATAPVLGQSAPVEVQPPLNRPPLTAPATRGADIKISQDPNPSYHPDSVGMILAAARAYGETAARGGWAPVPEPGTALRAGMSDPAIRLVRARLAASGDLDSNSASPLYDRELGQAVRRFQARHGLPETGIIGSATIKAMNVPAEERQRQLLSSARRLQDARFSFGPRYVVVNIPSAAVEAIDNGVVTRRYIAVVGDRAHPSPQIEARIGAVNFHPTWTVPISIIRNEIIPKMRKDPSFLARSKIRIFGASGREFDPSVIDWSSEEAVNYTLRQDSGAANSLGVVRIAMPNPHAVYMHDTPSKRFFGRDFRFLSHGCVRVADVSEMVAWILAPLGWTKEAVETAIATDERRDVRLPQPIPIAWVYLTGFVSPDGRVQFREDAYGLDGLEPPDPIATASVRRG